MDSGDAFRAFQARVAELGGEVLESAWLGAHKPHRVRCSAGHLNRPRPYDFVQRGKSSCRMCIGMAPAGAELAFRSRVAILGGTILEPTWLGARKPHRVLCNAGHPNSVLPNNVQQGSGLCRTCAGKDTKSAEAAFRARLAEHGGTLLEPVWLGSQTPHRVRCSVGHVTSPRPTNIGRGQGLCRTCAGRDSKDSELRFRARVAELGGAVLEPTWLGVHAPHRVRCGAGHDASPSPLGVLSGQGVCLVCRGKLWNVFYVVENEDDCHVKFGITSDDVRPRLQAHRRDGFLRVVRLLTGLPDGAARSLEKDILATLRLAREKPVRGREYFDARVLATVLDVVDHYPIPTLNIPGQGTGGRAGGVNEKTCARL